MLLIFASESKNSLYLSLVKFSYVLKKKKKIIIRICKNIIRNFFNRICESNKIPFREGFLGSSISILGEEEKDCIFVGKRMHPRHIDTCDNGFKDGWMETSMNYSSWKAKFIDYRKSL